MDVSPRRVEATYFNWCSGEVDHYMVQQAGLELPSPLPSPPSAGIQYSTITVPFLPINFSHSLYIAWKI